MVAGGGTGDAAIFLAEQLRDYDGEIVYLDISESSMEIARERASIRGLNNIVWHHCSILEMSEIDIGEFDYINCSGVLHHLKSPTDGLSALKSVMKDHSAMGIMIYGKYGRTGVTQMRRLMRFINANESDMETKVDNTKTVLDELPESNWFKLAEHLVNDHKRHGNIGIYDLFLHSQVRTYSVPEFFKLIESSNLNFVGFSRGTKLLYSPPAYISNERILDIVRSLPSKDQYAIAELIAGNIKNHAFYISNQNNTVASVEDLDNVPFRSIYSTPDQNEMAGTKPYLQFNLQPAVKRIPFHERKYAGILLKYVDGNRSIGEIFDCIREELGNPAIKDQELLDDFKPVYHHSNNLGLFMLRHKSVAPYKSFNDMQAPITEKYQM